MRKNMGKEEVKFDQRNSTTLKYGGSSLSCCWFGGVHAEPSLVQPNRDDGCAMLRGEASDGMQDHPGKDHALEASEGHAGEFGCFLAQTHSMSGSGAGGSL